MQRLSFRSTRRELRLYRDTWALQSTLSRVVTQSTLGATASIE